MPTTLASRLESSFRRSLPTIAQPSSLLDLIFRYGVRGFSRIVRVPLWLQVDLDASARPPYAYCVYNAAILAKRLGLPAISAIEFGVAGGNGLVFLDKMAGRIEREVGVKVEVYGFDSGKGLPPPQSAEDLPYWFQSSQYEMDHEDLRRKLSRSTLVLGDVAHTVPTFFSHFSPAPIGAVLNDLDFYSSTIESLKMFDFSAEHFLPRVFMFFDDTVGSEIEMYSDAVGQLRAISDFNALHRDIHIGLNRNLLARGRRLSYRWQIYYAHLKAHPDYSRYVWAEEHSGLEPLFRLGPRRW